MLQKMSKEELIILLAWKHRMM